MTRRSLHLAMICVGMAAGAATGDVLPGLPAPVTDADYRASSSAEVALGRLLFWDPLLSGNRNIACGTCHQPDFATADGVSLTLGEGGVGLGPDRVSGRENTPRQRIPRNTPALFNLGATEFTVMFGDGRIEVDPSRALGLRTPLDDSEVAGFANVLAAQVMFPVFSDDEMAGHGVENEIAIAVRLGHITGPGGAWQRVAERVAAIPEYQVRFAAANPGIAAGRAIAFPDIANAIAAFVGAEWRSDTAPFDAYLRGQARLEPQAMAGARLFYGDAGCSGCHSGAFQTDHHFHATGTPQLGPGKAERFELNSRDTGRMLVTRRPEDAYAFRTPSLRNVTVTGPWGHAGGHTDLAAFIAYHADPVAGLADYHPQAILPAFKPEKPDWEVMSSTKERDAIAASILAPPRALDEAQVNEIMAYLATLTDEAALKGRLKIPERVPSGLPVDSAR